MLQSGSRAARVATERPGRFENARMPGHPLSTLAGQVLPKKPQRLGALRDDDDDLARHAAAGDSIPKPPAESLDQA